MRIFELFCDPCVGPFCIVEYAIESDGSLQFCWRIFLMFALILPMFAIVAPVWIVWQVFR